MSQHHQPVSLSLDEIHAIEARAHALRAQAMAEGLRALGGFLRSLPHRFAVALHLPGQA
ncbi:hypothetical protein RSK20926_16367 [Roseobacter sp. SK209-2-6]|uniref:RSP_7527 family protein n=1 Tax=Roseobacter sp. SK209-2-6 TaxID=388739 RepID=UPI0000F3CFB2|nr:hypothetical protein [Roseobacter sp. SK209-2-6]EBA15248.1 hypothetical protein RSK20926_16367 [Roseobacter sp. SK209-2-6]